MSATAVMTDTAWTLDKAHSELNFQVRHLMITNVKGSFGDYDAVLKTGKHNLLPEQIELTIQSASITTGNEQRDEHLRSADFFDATHYPEIRFISRHLAVKSEDAFLLTGDLTIKNVTKPIELQVEVNGSVVDPWGNHKTGLHVSGKINRKDWGLGWNAVLEGGGVTVSEEVRINAEIQLIRQG